MDQFDQTFTERYATTILVVLVVVAVGLMLVDVQGRVLDHLTAVLNVA